MKRTWRLRALGSIVAVLAAAGLVVAPAEAAKRPYCRQGWGARTKQLGDNGPGPSRLRAVSSARSGCFDRLTFDLDGPVVTYRVEYVAQVLSDATGTPIPLRGGAFLSVVFGGAAFDQAGRPTYRPADRSNAVSVRGYETFRQVAFDGTFEGVTTFGLGVRAKLPFQVRVLPGPGTHSRLAVDVSHRWI